MKYSEILIQIHIPSQAPQIAKLTLEPQVMASELRYGLKKLLSGYGWSQEKHGFPTVISVSHMPWLGSDYENYIGRQEAVEHCLRHSFSFEQLEMFSLDQFDRHIVSIEDVETLLKVLEEPEQSCLEQK